MGYVRHVADLVNRALALLEAGRFDAAHASQDPPAQSRRHPDGRLRVSLTRISRPTHGAPPLADEPR
jgi:hypothetical protein